MRLEDKPTSRHFPKRFYFDRRWLEHPDFEQRVEQAWNGFQLGSPMFQVCGRIKSCRVALLKMKEEHQLNSGKAIRELKAKMEGLQQHGKDRNWAEWQQLQKDLGAEYRKEEIFWQQKSRIQWLKEGDLNTKFFHAHTLQKRKETA